MMSAPVLATIAAGLRCALVVDIGWDETIVTPVYELRAIEGRGVGVHGRCRRGIKVLREHWGLFLGAHLPEGIDPGLDETEEVMERLGYVISSPALENDTTTIPLAGRTVRIAFRDLARPAEKTFFSVTSAHQEASPDVSDDDDTPLPELLYNALLHSAIDVRAACVSRIIFVGGGSKIPGLQARVLEELRGIIARKGWVVGFRTPPPHPEEEEEGGIARERDSEAEKKAFVAAGEVRGVKSLGVWCGGSLFAGLKVRAKAEVERERFLSQVASGGTGLPHGW